MKKSALFGSLMALLIAAAPSSISAQETPFTGKVMTVIVPVGQQIQRALEPTLNAMCTSLGCAGVRFEFRPAGSGVPGVKECIAAKPDGLTLCFLAPAQMFVGVTREQPPYVLLDPEKGLLPIGTASELAPHVIAVGKKYADMKALIAHGSSRTPGSAPTVLTYGASYVSGQDFAAREFFANKGIELNIVPQPQSGTLIAEIKGDKLDFATFAMVSVGAYIRAGNIDPEFKILAVFSNKPTDFAPGIPPITDFGEWRAPTEAIAGFFVQAGTPKHVVDMLVAALEHANRSPEVAAELRKSFAMPRPGGPEFLREWIVETSGKIADLYRKYGIKKD